MSGAIHNGKQSARSDEYLEKQLFKQEIALLRAQVMRPLFLPRITKTMQASFFRNLAQLVAAGVRLHDALVITQAAVHNNYFAEIINDCAQGVHEGLPLSSMLNYYHQIFDEITIHVLQVGEESGQLARALDYVALHLEAMNEFSKKLRTALLMPLVTVIFFILIACIVFIVVVPRFESMFVSVKVTLPLLTRIIFTISAWVRSRYFFYCLGGVFFLIIGMWRSARTSQGKYWVDRILLSLPLIKTGVKDFSISLWCQSLALLLSGGMPLVQAMKIAAHAVNNSCMRAAFIASAYEVDGGYSLSSAVRTSPLLNDQELEALIAIGESTGALQRMIQESARIYRERVYRLLTLSTTIIQPLLLIVLGLLIGLLIVSIYVPLFSLSSLIE